MKTPQDKPGASVFNNQVVYNDEGFNPGKSSFKVAGTLRVPSADDNPRKS